MRITQIKNNQRYYLDNSKEIFNYIQELVKNDLLDFTLLEKDIDITNNISDIEVEIFSEEEKQLLIKKEDCIHSYKNSKGRYFKFNKESISRYIENIDTRLNSEKFNPDKISIHIEFLPINNKINDRNNGYKKVIFNLEKEDYKNIYLGKKVIIGSFYRTTNEGVKNIVKRDDYTLYIKKVQSNPTELFSSIDILSTIGSSLNKIKLV